MDIQNFIVIALEFQMHVDRYIEIYTIHTMKNIYRSNLTWANWDYIEIHTLIVYAQMRTTYLYKRRDPKCANLLLF